MPEQFSAKKTGGVKRQEGATLSGVFSARGGGGQNTRLESELLSAKKSHKGSQRARGLESTLASKLALRHLTLMMSVCQTIKYKGSRHFYQTNLAKILERVVAHLRVSF